MLDRLELETPEQIEVRYDLARLGSRFIAALWDTTILILLLLLSAFFASALIRVISLGFEIAGDLAAAIMVVYTFLLIWGYYIIFETIWNGQTPGKRITGIRVIRRDGYPIGITESLIRNIVRVADFLPSLYGLGMLVMFIDHESRRLGDFAAGTLVVHDSGQLTLARVRASGLEVPEAWSVPALPNLHRVGRAEVAAARRFLERRSSLTNADVLAAELAARLRPRIDPDNHLELTDTELLQRIVAQKRTG